MNNEVIYIHTQEICNFNFQRIIRHRDIFRGHTIEYSYCHEKQRNYMIVKKIWYG